MSAADPVILPLAGGAIDVQKVVIARGTLDRLAKPALAAE